MKKQIFTLLIMLALVAVTGKVFAQSTPTAPYVGATHTYIVGGLTDGDNYSFNVNQSAADFSTAGNASIATFTASSGTVSGGIASQTVTWAGIATSYVWIKIDDSDGCSTYRRLPVTPVTAIDYTVDFNVLALSTGDDTTLPASITGATGGTSISDACPGFVGEDWELSSTSDATTTDGSTYVYFRVIRTAAPATNAAWFFTPTFAGATASTLEISTDASVWTAYTNTTERSVAAGVNTVYIRATIANATTLQTVSLSIDAPQAYDAGGLEVDAETIGVNNASIAIDPLPEVGTFGGSF